MLVGQCRRTDMSRGMRTIGSSQGRRPGGRWCGTARNAVSTSHCTTGDALTTRYRWATLYCWNSAWLWHPLHCWYGGCGDLPFNSECTQQRHSQHSGTAALLLLFFFVIMDGSNASISLLLRPIVPEGAGELFLVYTTGQMRMRWVAN